MFYKGSKINYITLSICKANTIRSETGLGTNWSGCTMRELRERINSEQICNGIVHE